jgi:hypothetical protein
MVLMLVADVTEDRSPGILKPLVNRRRQMMIAGKLKLGRIERAGWLHPRIHDDNDVIGFCNEASVAQICNMHYRVAVDLGGL